MYYMVALYSKRDLNNASRLSSKVPIGAYFYHVMASRTRRRKTECRLQLCDFHSISKSKVSDYTNYNIIGYSTWKSYFEFTTAKPAAVCSSCETRRPLVNRSLLYINNNDDKCYKRICIFSS